MEPSEETLRELLGTKDKAEEATSREAATAALGAGERPSCQHFESGDSECNECEHRGACYPPQPDPPPDPNRLPMTREDALAFTQAGILELMELNAKSYEAQATDEKLSAVDRQDAQTMLEVARLTASQLRIALGVSTAVTKLYRPTPAEVKRAASNRYPRNRRR